MDNKKKGIGIFIAAILLISVFAVLPVIAVNTKNSAPSSHPTSGDSVYQGLLRIGISDYGELLFWNATEEAGLEYPDGYEHIAKGWWGEGYFVAYENATDDNWAYAMFDERSNSSWGPPIGVLYQSLIMS